MTMISADALMTARAICGGWMAAGEPESNAALVEAVAQAIDAAILSAKAEQQQKDAMIADVFARVEPNEDDEVSRIVFENANRRARAIASAIRTSSDQSAPANGG